MIYVTNMMLTNARTKIKVVAIINCIAPPLPHLYKVPAYPGPVSEDDEIFHVAF